jgi:hypothetical protein
MNAVRNLPQGSALDAPWGWMEQHHLAESSVIYPTFDLSNENKITQTAARFFFAVLLPTFAKPFGYANLGLGVTHLVWCVINIKKIRNKEDGCGPQDVEKALIRIFTGIYDLAIAYILYSSLLSTLWGRSIVILTIALVPAYPIQVHHWIFEKATKQIEKAGKDGAEKKIKTEIDHRALKVGCLIKQFCSGLVETFIPEPAPVPKGYGERALALPYALGTWGRSTFATLRGLPRDEGKSK